MRAPLVARPWVCARFHTCVCVYVRVGVCLYGRPASAAPSNCSRDHVRVGGHVSVSSTETVVSFSALPGSALIHGALSFDDHSPAVVRTHQDDDQVEFR